MPNVIDLFSGAGGLSLGAYRAGFNVVAAVEIDPQAISSHKINFPNSIHIQEDILELNGKSLLAKCHQSADDIIGIIGGPPCQGFSNIGHGDIKDSRNQLFIKFFEIVKDIHPAFFVAENVPGITKEKYNEIRERAFSYVPDYTLLPAIKIIASDYGAATSRTRYFFIGYRDDPRINPISIHDIEQKKVKDEQKTTVKQALEGLPKRIVYSPKNNGEKRLTFNYWNPNQKHEQSDFFYDRITKCQPIGVGDPSYVALYNTQHIVNGLFPTKHSKAVRKRYSELPYGKQDKISKSTKLDPNGFCPTLRAGTGPEKGSYQAVRPIHYQYARVITPREAARLQGFPDWYKLPNTIWHAFRQIGNSVSPIVAEQVLSAIYQKLT